MNTKARTVMNLDTYFQEVLPKIIQESAEEIPQLLIRRRKEKEYV